MKEGIKTVIVGKPNAGKSSLMNVLVGEERAIVTDIAGTTRDILEETIVLHGISLRMIDTAGIRDTEDKVEQIGVGRAKEYAKDADLILYVVDSSRPLDENDEEIMEILEDKKAIVLLNKTDLEQKVTEEMLKEKLSHPVVSISAKEEQGIDVLEKKIKNMPNYFDIRDACSDKSKPFCICWKKAGKNGAPSVGQVAVIPIEYFYELLKK